jgi:hypothetical protein
MAIPADPLSRRRSLRLLLGGAPALLLGGCALNAQSEAVGAATQPLSERIEALLQGKGKLPEFRPSQVDPAALLINSFNGNPRIPARQLPTRRDTTGKPSPEPRSGPPGGSAPAPVRHPPRLRGGMVGDRGLVGAAAG